MVIALVALSLLSLVCGGLAIYFIRKDYLNRKTNEKEREIRDRAGKLNEVIGELEKQVEELGRLKENRWKQVELANATLQEKEKERAVAEAQIISANTQFNDIMGQMTVAKETLNEVGAAIEKRKEGADVEVKEWIEGRRAAAEAQVVQEIKDEKDAATKELVAQLEVLRHQVDEKRNELGRAQSDEEAIGAELAIVRTDLERLKITHAEALRRSVQETGQTDARIRLTKEDADDVAAIHRAARGLRCENAIKKATYEVYVKPEIERLAREAGVNKVSGIYRIWTVKDGHEISYIGQAVDVGDRWKTHAKRAWGVDDTGRIVLYKEMMESGIENWSWELVEAYQPSASNASAEVSGSGAGVACDVSTFLSEREKYWGGFYGVKELGLNKKLG